ncbi:MAG: alpha/beta fold hydrolase [Pseudodonghicola sp.]
MAPTVDPEGDGLISRERIIAAIYEAVLRPELYDDFMDLWSEHVLLERAGEDDGIAGPGGDATGAALAGPELEAHFRRAFDILERIGRDRPAPGIARFVRDHPGYALLLRCDGSAVASSAAAQAGPGSAATLAALEDHLAAGSAVQLRGLLGACARPDCTADAVVLSTDFAARYLIARTHLTPGTPDEALVVIEPLQVRWSERAEALLARSFGLSPAELDLVRHLMAGRSLRQIAEETHRSEHTVRNQSKSVLAKTGTPSQADLIRLVSVLCREGVEGTEPAGPGPFGGRRHWLTTAAGRGFEVYEFGPPDGRPVLFLHGMMEALAGLARIRPALQRRGLRVLAPVRPGYGHSAPLSRADGAIAASLAQADAIWERFDPGRAVVVGHMAGAMHGFALAARAPGRVAGLVSVAGGVPFRSTAEFATMAPRQRIVAYTARLAPVLLPAILRAGISQIDGHMVTDFAQALYAEGTCDHALMRDPALCDAICGAYRFSVLQGHHGFWGDSYDAVRDWSAYVEATRCPVHLLHGVQDPAIPIGNVRALAARYPRLSLTALEGCGQLLFYDRADLVLDSIASLAIGAGAAA